MKILTINPGSTSTKIGIFDGDKPILTKTIHHGADDLARFDTLIDQLGYRLELIECILTAEGHNIEGFDGFIGRGGLVRPIESGGYRVSAAMIDDLRSGRTGVHASNLGGLLAH
ncbi:MAG: butyrate kinase, partial [Clostridiales bacterium]|nr:butyrate kinase [Clostridiales bacterium]